LLLLLLDTTELDDAGDDNKRGSVDTLGARKSNRMKNRLSERSTSGKKDSSVGAIASEPRKLSMSGDNAASRKSLRDGSRGKRFSMDMESREGQSVDMVSTRKSSRDAGGSHGKLAVGTQSSLKSKLQVGGTSDARKRTSSKQSNSFTGVGSRKESKSFGSTDTSLIGTSGSRAVSVDSVVTPSIAPSLKPSSVLR